MANLLLNLRNVPDDEAEEVRSLLVQHAIAFYETEPNRWGISAGAIWIRDLDQIEKAKSLMATYQAQRTSRAHGEYEAARLAGTAETFMAQVRKQPLRLLLVLLGIVFCIAVSLWPLLLSSR